GGTALRIAVWSNPVRRLILIARGSPRRDQQGTTQAEPRATGSAAGTGGHLSQGAGQTSREALPKLRGHGGRPGALAARGAYCRPARRLAFAALAGRAPATLAHHLGCRAGPGGRGSRPGTVVDAGAVRPLCFRHARENAFTPTPATPPGPPRAAGRSSPTSRPAA